MHFTPVELNRIGSLLMHKRKEQGLLLKHLADENISASTISSIERGAGNVKPEKIRYYATKLGVDLEHLPKLVENFEETQQEIKRKLDLIDTSIDLVGPDHALQKLKAFDISYANETLKAFYLYLHGRCYMHKKHWDKARKYFKDVLHLYNNNPSLEQDKSNIKAACLKELGRICYFYENDIKQALMYTDEALKVFMDDGEKSSVKHSLLIGKVIYYEKLHKLEEAHKTLNLLWKKIDEIKNLEIILNMFEARANILAEMGLYEEAKSFVLKGLEIARVNKQYDRAFELLTALGKIHVMQNEFEKAEEYFLLSLNLSDKIKNKKDYLLITAYTQLGKLYLIQGKSNKAKENIEKAIAIGNKIKEYHRTNEALIALGDYYLEQEQFQEALTPYKKALETASKFENYDATLELYLKLAQCYKKFDSDQFTKCMEDLFHHQLEYYKVLSRNKGGNNHAVNESFLSSN